LDAAFGVAAVAAHVPFAHSAMIAGFWVRSAHHANDELTSHEAAALRRLNHLTEGFVSENEVTFARWGLGESTLDDLYIRATDAGGPASDQQRAASWVWQRYVDHLRRVGDSRADSQRFHMTSRLSLSFTWRFPIVAARSLVSWTMPTVRAVSHGERGLSVPR